MLITVDFESFYDKEFSLSKITTEDYVRDDRFEVIGVGVKVNEEPAQWFSGTFEETKQWLEQFPWAESLVLAHNAMFDAAILTWRFGIKPKGWLDTLCMARAVHGMEVGNSLAKLSEYYELGAKGTEVVAALGKRREDFSEYDLAQYGGYCKNDVELTYKLFGCLEGYFKPSELKLIDLTVKMFSEPVLELDLPILEQHLEEVKDKKQKLLDACSTELDALMSNQKFAEKLRELGVDPPMKISNTTGKEAYAFAKTDEGFKELMEHPDEQVQALVAARLGNKSTLAETRTQRFIDIGKRGKLPVPLKYYAARTGRWGGADQVNLQNLPRKSPIKTAIKPPSGFILIDADSSQIEARTLAWLSGQNDLVEAFEKGEDVYKIMASKIYNKEVEDITDDERFVGKTAILGCGYGLGADKLHIQLKTFNRDVPVDACRRIIDAYRRAYPAIPMLWKQGDSCLEALAKDQGTVFGAQPQAVNFLPMIGFDLPSGLQIRYPELRRIHDPARYSDEYAYQTKTGFVKIYGGKVVENVCQAVARCAIGEQMLRVAKRYKVAMTVHDSIIAIAPVEEKEQAAKYVQECMRWRPKWAQTLPLNCEVKYGDSYGTTSKYTG
jgi:DNA polymerase I-like protein with 3'-5' exonuclease and polymerase domains